MNKLSNQTGSRWETTLLWKSDKPELPDSRPAALRRLNILEKLMDKDPQFCESYCAKIKDYLDQEFCKKLTDEEIKSTENPIWYLPHFGHFNPNKPGKLRLVFDWISLNDALIQGPDLMSPLLNVLMKFRQREVAFSGDIKDMFHRVMLRKEDSCSLRFLWRGRDRSKPPEEYAMTVVIFGAVSSPYQAQCTKNRNASDFIDQFPEAVEAIHNRHYVDDYLDSCKSVEDAIQKIIAVRKVHRLGGFEIRGWLSNKEEVIKVVEPKPQENTILNVDDKKLERVLGLHWDPKEDVFRFKNNYRSINEKIISEEEIPTKRELLRLVMSVFDPLGFLASLTIRGRILLQDVWRSPVEWDEKLPSNLHQKWFKFLRQLKEISEVSIPRCYGPNISDSIENDIHIFCDASSQAFCVVAYLRSVDADGVITTNIVMAKARVAPTKVTSIPRLELEAALIGSRMMKFILENLDLPIRRVFLWTDSKNVLSWIRSEDPRKFKVYIAHRIGEILENSEVGQWRWIPTLENVSDEGTRDSGESNIQPNSRWMIGPDFLKRPMTEWPLETNCKESVPEENLELRRECCFVMTEEVEILVEKFSSWKKLVRVISWIFRFINNSRGGGFKISDNLLGIEEMKNAENFLINQCQHDSFEEEFNNLKEGKVVEKGSKLWKLSPILLGGTICLKSRLNMSPDTPLDLRYPIILDGKHQIAKLLIKHYHALCGHHGTETVCSEIRQKFWIIGLKNAVKKAEFTCWECKMRRAKPIAPEMSPLPDVRIRRPVRAFSFVGIDYFGPIEVKNKRKLEKRYGVLFTCLSTRAVHLKVANSLRTDEFILLLNRFMCRRGEPQEIYSDNGSNLKGADKELKTAIKDMNKANIENNLRQRGIKWNFIPPAAPHFGGSWERMVRSVKKALAIILRGRTPNDQLLATVFAEAEATVNSRPITVVSNDPNDEEALTPSCFLLGTSSFRLGKMVVSDVDMSLKKAWKQSEYLANHFWRRWLREYLPMLGPRTKWFQKTEDIKVGEIVFIPDANPLRNVWKKGVVEQIQQGRDGFVRVVKVRTSTGILTRPVVKILRIL